MYYKPLYYYVYEIYNEELGTFYRGSITLGLE